MRLRLAHIGLSLWLLTGQQPTYAQQQRSGESSQHAISCPSAPTHDESPSGPEISISDVTFSGLIQMPISDQDEIVASIKRETHGSPPNDLVEEALERVRAGFQDHGYFKVRVSGEARTSSRSATDPQIALFVRVDENMQYRLGRITFKNNKAIASSTALRDLFPIKDGDIFSRKKIAKGLENIRKAYDQYGYINFTGVPSTTFDDEKKLAYLEIDVDEGKQFFVSGIDVEGLDEPARLKVLSDLLVKPGQIYNGRLWQLSLLKFGSLFPGCACRPSQPLQLDEQTGTVAVTLDFRPCSAN
jgi:outer membrane protein insertion porin family